MTESDWVSILDCELVLNILKHGPNTLNGIAKVLDWRIDGILDWERAMRAIRVLKADGKAEYSGFKSSREGLWRLR